MKVHVLGSLQTMSYSTHQDRAPVRSIGNINAIDYVQGQRTIAGTMVFAMFHQHWMTPLLEELADHVSNTDIWSDELPALNLTISMANEYGYKSNMVLYGVKFIDDGGVMSINDLYTENTLQYVATGIQPLKTSGQYEHSYYPTFHPFYISDYSVVPRKIWEFNQDAYTKTWPKFRDIVIDVATISPTIYPFTLSAIIDPPISYNFFDMNLEDAPHNNYVVNIIPEIIDPRDKITNIFLNKKDDGGDGSITKEYECIKHPITNKWVSSVPRGYYDINIETESGTVHENVFDLEVSENTVSSIIDDTVTADDKNCPVIFGVEDTAISIIPNLTHDIIEVKRVEPSFENLYQDIEVDNIKLNVNTDIPVGKSNSKDLLIEDLLPNSKYYISTYDSETGERSKYSVAKTFSHREYANDLLKNFIKTNEDILVNKELVSIDLSEAKFEYNNILDSLIDFNESELKPELLLYATILQNKIISTYNDNGIGKNATFDAQSILDNTYYFDNEVENIVLYRKQKTKSYYILKSEDAGMFRYNGEYNTHYYIQPNLKVNKKAACVDFVCFNQQHQNLLDVYRSDIDLDSLSIMRDSYTYDSYNEDLIRAIKAAENISLYQNILEEPHAVLHNDTLVIDVNYSEKSINTKMNNLYLCIASPEEAVNHTPIMKIKINGENMVLDKFDALILKNSYYLLWIQDSDFNNISSVFILSTYDNDVDMIDFYRNRNEAKLKSISSLFSGGTTYRTYVNAAVDVVLAEDNLAYKNIEYYVLQALLLLYEDHLISRTIDDVMSHIVSTYYNKSHIDCKFIKAGEDITFESSNKKATIACVNITQYGITKHNFEDSYDINTHNEGYTLVYLTDRNLTSNVMLINSATKEIFSSNIILEVIK